MTDLTDLSNGNFNVHLVKEVHLSLSRGHFTLRFHQIQPFISHLAARLKLVMSFYLCLNQAKLLFNDGKTRGFICLCNSTHPTGPFNELLQVVKTCYDEYNCAVMDEEYDEEFIAHCSLYWFTPEKQGEAEQLIQAIQV